VSTQNGVAEAGNSSPGKAAGVGRLSNLWTPQWQQTVTLGVAILQCGTLPFLTTTSMSAQSVSTPAEERLIRAITVTEGQTTQMQTYTFNFCFTGLFTSYSGIGLDPKQKLWA